jgi:acetolactate synthase-1/2/3 large subunit
MIPKCRKLSGSNTVYKGLTGGQIIYTKLLEHETKTVFMYTGGAIMPVIDAFVDGKINYFINCHEQSTGHSATGYAKSTGKPGVCIVTSGPGLTNLVTPITDANNDSTPLIVFSGQVSKVSMGSESFQECPSTEITKSITKWNYCVDNIQELSDVIDHAFQIATSGRPGAVHIDLPKCITSSLYNDEIDGYNKINRFLIDDTISEYGGNINCKMPHVYDLISNSKYPVIIVGKGCVNATEQLRELVELTNIPVTSTIFGMGILPEDDMRSLEFLGMHGNVAANYAIQKADLIINLGSRFDDRTTGNTKYYGRNANEAYNKHKGGIIHVNLDSNEICRNIKSHYNFITRCEDFLDELLPIARRDSSKNCNMERREWLRQINTWKLDNPFYTNPPGNNTINTQMVTQRLGIWLNNRYKYDTKYQYNTTYKNPFYVSTGVGNHQMMAAQFIKWNSPNQFVSSGSLGVMGSGLPYAIGAQIANPDCLVLDIDGDGSFNHTLSELKTVQNYNLPIKIAIMNDGELSMVRAWENLFFDSRYVATNLIQNPDYVKLAESFGVKAFRCERVDELDKTIDTFLGWEGPVLCDFRVNSDICLPLIKPGKAIDDMYQFSCTMSNGENIDRSEVPG